MKKAHKPNKRTLPNKIVDVLITYARTYLLLIIVVTLLAWLMLSWLGVRFALLLALITGSLSVVPILGITVAAVIACLVAIFDGVRFLPTSPPLFEGLLVVVIYGILNFAVDYLLSPYLIGKSTNIPPLLLLVLVLMGTWIFGVWGALMTVPVILVIKTIIEDNKQKRNPAN